MGDIRIITEPTVRLVGHQVIVDAQLDAFLKDEGVEGWETDTDVGAQKLVETSGRLCYKSYAKPRPGGNAAYIGHVLEAKHGSVCEHAVYNFIITGVSRSFSHELVRHRAGWAYSQRSQRFCDEGDLAAVVPPALADEVAEARHTMKDWGCTAQSLLQEGRCTESVVAGLIWIHNMERARDDYSWLSNYLTNRHVLVKDKTLFRKKAREAARSVLPNATETQIFVTVNARAARHFIEARGDEHADAEIRSVAILMLDILRMHSPNLFGDYTTHDVPGSGTVATTTHRKV